MAPNAPPPWLTFLVMFVAVSIAVGLIVLLGGISRVVRGESFWPPRDGERERPSPARSRGRYQRRPAGSGVRAGSESANATLRHQDGTFAGSASSRSGSDVRESPAPRADTAPVIDEAMPRNLDELAWAIEAVRLRTTGEEPSKEAAIIRAFPHVNSKGGGAWQRASQLYDTVSKAQKAGQTPLATNGHAVEV